MEHHAAGLAALDDHELGPERIRELREAPTKASSSDRFTGRERALLAYALLVNDRPADVTESDLAPLRAVGLTDAEILDANLVVGYFAFANRLTLGLGVTLEPDEHALGQ